MPDPQVPTPEKTITPPTGVKKGEVPVVAPARRFQAVDDDDNSASSDTPFPSSTAMPKNSPGIVIALGVVCAILAISVIVLWGKLGIRDKTIEQRTNRTEQLQTGATHLQEELNDAKAETVRVQKQLEESKAASSLLKSDLDKAKANALDLQGQLEKSRTASTDFQTQMAAAQVASLKRQGEVEVAQAQTTVMQTQLNKAKGDVSQLQTQLTEAKAQTADLQGKLEKVQKELLETQKPPAKK